MSTSTLIIGVGGHAVAIDPTTGDELWRTKLKGSSFVTVRRGPGRVFAGTRGELFCLDEATGAILWRNRLGGLGYGLVAFMGTDSEVAGQAAADQANAAGGAAAASAST
jgi:outer membrane protein assembly factor BamB